MEGQERRILRIKGKVDISNKRVNIIMKEEENEDEEKKTKKKKKYK